MSMWAAHVTTCHGNGGFWWLQFQYQPDKADEGRDWQSLRVARNWKTQVSWFVTVLILVTTVAWSAWCEGSTHRPGTMYTTCLLKTMFQCFMMWLWVKTLVPSEPPKIAGKYGKWMFIPLKMDDYRYWPIPILNIPMIYLWYTYISNDVSLRCRVALPLRFQCCWSRFPPSMQFQPVASHGQRHSPHRRNGIWSR